MPESARARASSLPCPDSPGGHHEDGRRTSISRLCFKASALTAVVLGLLLSHHAGFGAARPVDFNRDVRPILSENCFHCHGQDANHRKAKLRLDVAPSGAAVPDKRAEGVGNAAITPGRPEASTLVQRIVSTDPEEQMPPPGSHRSLTASQRALLERWIAEGAIYDRHWAFKPVVRPALPDVREAGWVRQPWDAFVLARLETEGLRPSREASPMTWLRRVSFDLTGLSPTPEEATRFEHEVARDGEEAYVRAVERLSSSPAFGERQAQEWLDVARFADTHGFNNDTTRTMWRWRDWVIEAFNQGMPYDRFLTEQLAGDLLPTPTSEQRIATGFGRNHVVNSEGGIIDEEYRVEYVADRVRTLGMAWLGLTLECSRCHDHKFDPVTQRDYYRLFAFFNNLAEYGEDGRIGNAAPILAAPTFEQQRRIAALDREIESTSNALRQSRRPSSRTFEATRGQLMARPRVPAPDDASFVLSGDSKPAGQPASDWESVLEFADPTERVLEVKPAVFSAAQPWTLAAWVRWSGGEMPILSSMDLFVDPSAGGSGRGAEVRINAKGQIEARLAEFWPAYAIAVVSEASLTSNAWHHVVVSYDASTKAAGVRLGLEGRSADGVIRRDGLTGKSVSPHSPRLGSTIAKAPEHARGAVAGLRLYARVLEADTLAAWIEDQWLRGSRSRPGEAFGTREESDALVWRAASASYAALWNRREQLRQERQALLRAAPQTMVMAERETPRTTYFLRRGRYDAREGEVDAGVPEELLGRWPAGAPRNRLGLARWLTQPDQPLTSRVVVNRFWAQLFGTGLVKTVEDFGVQGEAPSHPELLDWLARDFVDSGWDVKRWFRMVVLSATYRQDSTVPAELRERDPANRLLARGPRVRLPAEVIRDHALAIAGLLETKVGGPSVFPVQPESLYTGVVVAADYPGTKWVTSEGADRYRRSLYTFWKRTVPHPVMTTFDAPDREVCTARRLPTNTPLQALALMNEPAFVEAGRRLGLRAWLEGGALDEDRLVRLFLLATARVPEARERQALERTLNRLRDGFAADPDGVRALLRRNGTATEAAWAALGGLVLNLDESITKN